MSKPPPQQRRTSASGCSTSSSALAALQLQQSWQQAFHLQQQLNSSQFMPLSSQRVVAVTTPPASIGQLTQAGMRLNVSPQMLFSPPHASAAATLQLLGHPTASLPFGFLPHFGLHGPPPGLAMLTQLQQHASLGALRNDGSVRFRPRIASDSEISSAANNDMLSSSSRRSERPKEPFLETARSVNCSNTTTCSRSSKTNDATLSDDKLPSKDNSKRPLTDARFRSESFNATQPCQQDGTTDQSAYHHLQQRVTSATTVSSGHQQRSYGNANGYRNLPETKSVASHGRLEAAIASASRMQNLQQSNGNSKASSFSQGGHSRSAGSTQVPPRVDSSFRGRVHQQSSFRGNNVGLRFAKRGFGGSYLKYSTDRRAPFLPLRGGAASTRGRMDARTSSRSQQRDNTNNSNSVSDRQYACSPTSGRSHSRSPAQSLRQLRATSKSGTSSLRCDHTSGPPAQPRPRPHYAASDYNTNLASLRSKTSKRSAASSSSNRTSPVRLSNRMSSQSSKKQGDDFTNNDDTSSQSVGLKRKLEKEEKTSRCVKKVRQEAGQSATPTSGTSRVTAADKSESEMLASNRLVRYTPDSSTAEDDTDDDVTSVHSKTTVKDSVAADGQSDERVGVADVESVSDYSLASSDLEDVTSDISESDEDSADLALPNRATYWTECAPATLHFKREQTMLLALPVDRSRDNCALMLLPPSINVQQRIVRHLLVASARLQGVQAEFETVLERRKRSLLPRPSHDPPPLAELLQKFACHSCCRKSNDDDGSDDADDSDSHSDDDDDSQSSGTAANSKGGGRWTFAQQEIARKIGHPDRLHLEMWFNEKQQANDGPLCRCSWRSRKIGIRHSYYPGEKVIPLCDPVSNNYGKLYHYRIVISPEINFTSKPNTVIRHDNRDYFFEGFSVFCHQKIPDCLPSCRVMRYNIEYSICYIEEEAPENFTVKDLDLFWEYIFVQLLEFLDLNLTPTGAEETTTCPLFHVLPRFARNVEEGGKQLLSSSQILTYLLRNSGSLVPNNKPANLMALSDNAWQSFVEPFKGQLVTNPSKRPSTVRVDQLDRTASLNPRDGSTANFAAGRTSDGFPVVVHFGLKPAMLTYAGNADYQKAYKQLVKFRHLLANKPKVTTEERTKLAQKEAFLQHLRAKASLKRDVTIELSSKGFFRTGLYTDVTQHASMLPVLFSQLRLHWALATLEERLQYKFKSRSLLELALTHPSYRTNYGTNPDHTRNTLTNCGMRQPVYGDGRVHQNYTRKRGINTLIDIMARMGTRKARRSRIMNNERLEYLGDAVVEFLSTIHLFHMFPELQEGGLATYRSALVQNRQLAALARRLGLDEFMLYAHGPDLCHESDLRHAMANCFEAVMAALFLDAGLDVADRVYAEALFPKAEEPMLHTAWNDLPRDPLQEEEPNGDRHWIPSVRILKKLTKFEDATGIHFDHIRILARAFTRRNVGYNFLTHGHNQRMEFLGDTVLQLVTSVYLYKHFPDHHEGHLSLLRSCLVNNKTQSVICDDLGLVEFLVNPPALGRTPAPQELRIKDKADLVESLIGAIFLDCGLDLCKIFCRICFFPRLKYFIMTQKWNDAKSQLQQCCLTLRSPSGGEPDIPTYKVIQARGPTNTRIYTVAVYFRGKRLSSGRGHSVQQAEMCAAELAIKQCGCLFPHLEKQRTIIERRFRQMPEKFYLGRKHTRTVNQHQEFNQ